MATRKKVETENTEVIFESGAVENASPPQKINFDEKITIRSIAPWQVGWNKLETRGEINLVPYGSLRITRAEFIAGYENGNKLICGEGDGIHATVYTDDEAVRNYLGIEAPILNKAYIGEIFKVKDYNEFEQKIKDTFTTVSEKQLLVKTMQELHIEDNNKVMICKLACGLEI